MKLKGTRLGDSFRLTIDGKITRDGRATEAKLDVATRLKRRKSKKVRVAKKGAAEPAGPRWKSDAAQAQSPPGKPTRR